MISSENIFFCTKKTTALTSIFDVILICQTLQKWKQIGKMKSKIVWKNHLEFFKYFLCQEMNKIINSWKHSSNGKKCFKTNDYVLRWHYSQVSIYILTRTMDSKHIILLHGKNLRLFSNKTLIKSPRRGFKALWGFFSGFCDN